MELGRDQKSEGVSCFGLLSAYLLRIWRFCFLCRVSCGFWEAVSVLVLGCFGGVSLESPSGFSFLFLFCLGFREAFRVSAALWCHLRSISLFSCLCLSMVSGLWWSLFLNPRLILLCACPAFSPVIYEI